MNNKRDPNPRQKQQQLSSIINMLIIYLISGALIVYGGVNVSLNTLQCYRGMYTNQWAAALPFVLCFGLAPITAGIMLLILHPATRNEK